MAISQTDIDRLEAALMRGELTVEYDGQRVTYRSVAELKAAIAYAKDALAAATPAGAQTVSYAAFARD
ncbi:MAG: phage head-tail joining protein [Reyranellaceae bacterium]